MLNTQTEKQVTEAAWNYMKQYQESHNETDLDTLAAVYQSHYTFLMNIKQPKNVRVTVGDILQLTVDYSLYDGKHGEPCLEILGAKFDSGRKMTEDNLDIMNNEIASAVEKSLCL